MTALWRESLKNWRFVLPLILALIGLASFSTVLPYFFMEILLPKPGLQLIDPVLNFFTPRDWSMEIFILIYSCTILLLIFNIGNPRIVLLGLETYVTVTFVRLLSLYLFTLEAPEGTIPLRDPVLSVFAYGQPIYVKDLFFSGHVSTLCVFVFIEQRRALKYFFLISTVAIAVFLAWQRVHYTLDMVAAPIITWIVFRLFNWANPQLVDNPSFRD
jgi:hypothetical protein